MSEKNENVNASPKGDNEDVLHSLFGDEEEEPKKVSRTVSLRTFIVSSVALVLAAVMLTFTVMQGIYRNSLASIIGAGFWGGSSNSEESVDDVALLDAIFERYSIYDLDDEDMAVAVLNAYVEATGDKYAEYYTEEEYQSFKMSSTGDFEGVGISIIYTSITYNDAEMNVMKIINVMRNSPALEAGVRAGDVLAYVGVGEGRESVDSLGYADTMTALLGEAGTVAEFTVLRPVDDGFEEIPFKITRGYVKEESVYSRICSTDQSVGVVKITEFNLATPEQFSRAVDELISKGISKIVFDVRYNPGGDLGAIVAVLSYFLEEGQTIISTVDKNGNEEIIKAAVVDDYKGDAAGCNVKKEDIGKYKDLSVAVLCNENTASAAELFVSNFRDYSLGKTVGVTTYGKGSVQSIIPFSAYNRKGAIRLTTRMYFPPCAESYDGIGITPDVTVELSEAAANINIYELSDADDNQLQEAIKTLK